MMVEHGITVDHATIHRWTVHDAPLPLERVDQRERAICRIAQGAGQSRSRSGRATT